MSNSETPAIELDNTPLHGVPLVASILMRIRICQTIAALDFTIDGMAQDFDILTPEDCNTITAACDAKRAMLTSNGAIVVEDRSVPVTGQTIGDIVANANAETIQARRTARSATARAAQSPEAIRTAVIAARSAVTALLADGQAFAVDVTIGKLGVIVAFGRRKAEVDPVTLKDRQALIAWADVLAALESAKLDKELLGGSPSAHRHAGDAVMIHNSTGYVVRSVKNPLGCEAQWIVGVVNRDTSTASLGHKNLTVTLYKDGRIETDHDTALATEIKRDFYRRTGEDRITATQLKDKIERALIVECGARDCDLGLYVAPSQSAKARTLITALRPVAARNLYMVTPASAEEISDGLAVGFEAEISKIESDVAERQSDLKRGSGAALIERIEHARQSALGLGAILGQATADQYLARIRAMDAAVTTALDATSARYAALELT